MKNSVKNIKNRDQIISELKSLSDLKYKDFSQGLSMGQKPMIGVRTPLIRDYAKSLSSDICLYFDILGNTYYEEIFLKGLMIGYSKISIEERIAYLEKFIPLIDNWAVCDQVCSTLKFTKKNQEIMWEFINNYINSSSEFYVRFAIIMMLDYFVDDKYVKDVIRIIDKLDYKNTCDKYYIKMAVAWLISVIVVKYRNLGIDYLKNDNNLDDFTINKSIQKCIDSFRVSDEDKKYLRTLRKKN